MNITVKKLEAMKVSSIGSIEEIYVNKFIDGLIERITSSKKDIIERMAMEYLEIPAKPAIPVKRTHEILLQFIATHWPQEVVAVVCFVIGAAVETLRIKE